MSEATAAAPTQARTREHKGKKLQVVEVGDLRVSTQKGNFLGTFALGSCIAIAIYDPFVKLGGLLHFMLPEASIDPERSKSNAATFGDTGFKLMLDRLESLGGKTRRYKAYMIGGAQPLASGGSSTFAIGKRNLLQARKMLWNADIQITGDESGGNASRTVYLDLDTGEVSVRTPDRKEIIL